MKEQKERKSPVLIVENFGPIDRSEIEFGDFTVIIGPNSSGKTFLLSLIDRLMNFVSQSVNFSISRIVFRAVEKIVIEDKGQSYPVNVNMSEQSDQDIQRIVDYVIKNQSQKEGFPGLDPKYVNSELFRYFQTEPKNLIKFGKDQATITAHFEQMSIKIMIKEDKEPQVEFFLERDFILKYVKGFRAFYQGKGGGSYGSSYVNPSFQRVLIPTERISVLVTMSSIIEDLAKTRGFQFVYPMFQGIRQAYQNQTKLSLTDFLTNYLNAIQILTQSKKEFSSHASSLIGGKITINTNVPAFVNFIVGKNVIPLLLTSSGTLQLISLVVMGETDMYNTLLIEEPEINLHANKQVEVAEYLWKLVEEKGKMVVVSTHSDYFVMKLA